MQPERPVQTTLAFHSSRIIIDVGVLLAMASMSLPFVVSDLGNRSALHADALPAILLLLPVFAITLIPDHTRPIHPIAAWVSLALGIAALPYSIVKLLDAGVLANTLDGSLGFGAFLLIVGVVVTMAGIGIGLFRNLRGLPTGGTPGRSAAYETRSSGLRAPGSAPRRRNRPTTAPEALAAPLRPVDTPAAPPAAPAPAPGVSAPPASGPSRQPGFVYADEGAASRQADFSPEADMPSEAATTAERADAAIDDHILSMFGDEEPDESD